MFGTSGRTEPNGLLRITWSKYGERITSTTRYAMPIRNVVESRARRTVGSANAIARRRATPPKSVVVAKISVETENWPSRVSDRSRTKARRPIPPRT